jgi:hypothetical protein
MPTKVEYAPKFLNVDVKSLGLSLGDEASGDLSFDTSDRDHPMWDPIYFRFMYLTMHAEDKKNGIPETDYFLKPPASLARWYSLLIALRPL